MIQDELLSVAKPIPLKTWEVQAILDGRKTQTRQVIKPANPFKSTAMGGYRQGEGLWIDGYRDSDEPNGHIKDYSISSCWWRKQDYINRYSLYKPGDILYVREMWQIGNPWGEVANGTQTALYYYRADYSHSKHRVKITENDHKNLGVWKPSIHMPKEAARIFLRVTDVRVERLQDISGSDVIAEGFKAIIRHTTVNGNMHNGSTSAREEFYKLWDKLNAKRGYGWDKDPWVWVYEFERVTPDEK